MAALAGAVAGCGKPEEKKPAAQSAPAAPAESAESEKPKSDDAEVAATDAEAHLCRGLNTCKGKGAGGENACAGQGDCATVAHHTCGSKNTCKNLGGCGEDAGANACKGKGGCHVPLMKSAWETVRKRFESKMKEEGKEFGEAPAEKEEKAEKS